MQVYNKLLPAIHSRTRNRRTRIDIAFCALVLALLVFQLFVPPALSVANDHDFEKIMGHLCLGPELTNETPYFDYTVYRYVYDADYCIDWPMRTTNEATFRVGLWLDHLFYSKTDFDIRFMGIVYGLVFFAGFLSLQYALRYVALKLSIATQAIWIVVVCNAVYVPWLNTLYYDTLSIATLTGALAWLGIVALRKRLTAGSILVASIWVAVFAGSKSQHAPMGVLCIPVLWLAWRSHPLRITTARVAGTFLILAGAALSLGTTPRFYQGEATFNALFYRILPAVKNPAAYLAETKIPSSWAQFTGETAFAEDVPLRDFDYEVKFGEWFGPIDLVRLYFRHPSAAWLIARQNLDEASMDRVRIRMSGVPHKLGNYPETLGKPPQTISHFLTLWASIKDKLFGAQPLLYAGFIIAVIALAWLLAPPGRPMRLLLAIVTLSLAGEFVISMMDGADGGRHLLLFTYLLDLLACADAVFAIGKFILKPEATSDKEHSPS